MHAQERLIRRLFTTQHCSHCQCAYEGENVTVLARRSEVWMVMVRCDSCGRKGIFVISFPGSTRSERRKAILEAEALGEGALTEAALADEPPAAADADPGAPVTADDVIDMHLFLKGFDGNFAALFASPPGGEQHFLD
ncbi:MAG TPA: hypothetical protein VH599_03775 [Ktedonobacterales bacterium]|jgi:hypothetical protein